MKICENCGNEEDVNVESCSYCNHKFPMIEFGIDFKLTPLTEKEKSDYKDYKREKREKKREGWKRNYKIPVKKYESNIIKNQPKSKKRKIWNKILGFFIITLIFMTFSGYINDLENENTIINDEQYTEDNNGYQDNENEALIGYDLIYHEFTNVFINSSGFNSSVNNCSLKIMEENYEWSIKITGECSNYTDYGLAEDYNDMIVSWYPSLSVICQLDRGPPYSIFTRGGETEFEFSIYPVSRARHFNISISYICLNSTG